MSTAGGDASGPLAGTRVVVTRSRARASGLVDRLSVLGASVVELPVIAVVGPADGGAALADAADALVAGRYRWVVVTSQNGAARVVDALGGRSPAAGTRWAAVGPTTARSLREGGVTVDLVPVVAVSDALVEAFPEASTVDREEGEHGIGSVLFVRAERVRAAVAPGLSAKGWRVDDVVAYRTVAGIVDRRAIDEARSADAVAFTSSSTVERTVEVLGVDGVPPVIASIGPITSASVRAVGLDVAVEAGEHTLEGLVTALVAALRGPEGKMPTA